MNNERRREIAAGLFLFFGLLILLFGISWLKDYWSLRKTYPVQVVLGDVSGLRLNDPVDVGGVIKGKVTGIQMQRNGLLVTLAIEEEVEIPIDSRLSMRTLSLFTGEKYIKVELGESHLVMQDTPDSIYQGGYLDEFSLEHLQRALMRIEELISEIELEGIETALQEGIADLVDEAERAIRPVARRGEQMGQAIDDLASAAENLNSILADIESGQGTLGKTLSNDSLYNNLNDATEELKTLIADIRENPERYLKVDVKLF